jgi:hypothetical protein
MTFVREPAQSTAARRPLQAARAAFLLAIVGAATTPCPAELGAQSVTVEREGEPVFAEVRGARLGRVSAGASFASGDVSGGHTRITLDGWIFRSSVEPAARDGRDLSVSREENLRDGPNGRIVARLLPGVLLDEIGRQGSWVHVRRDVWLSNVGLRGSQSSQASAPRPARQDQGAVAPTADPQRALVRRRLNLFRGPDSTAIGTLEAGVPVRITARAEGWVLIEAQAWVRENEIRLSDNAILTGVSAAELRGAPEEFRGRLLRWTVQFLALQVADELRPDFQPGQRYVLARGPAPEYAFVYILVPNDKLADVQRLAPLASVEVVARVVAGRSAYLANPILELVDLP